MFDSKEHRQFIGRTFVTKFKHKGISALLGALPQADDIYKKYHLYATLCRVGHKPALKGLLSLWVQNEQVGSDLLEKFISNAPSWVFDELVSLLDDKNPEIVVSASVWTSQLAAERTRSALCKLLSVVDTLNYFLIAKSISKLVELDPDAALDALFVHFVPFDKAVSIIRRAYLSEELAPPQSRIFDLARSAPPAARLAAQHKLVLDGDKSWLPSFDLELRRAVESLGGFAEAIKNKLFYDFARLLISNGDAHWRAALLSEEQKHPEDELIQKLIFECDPDLAIPRICEKLSQVDGDKKLEILIPNVHRFKEKSLPIIDLALSTGNDKVKAKASSLKKDVLSSTFPELDSYGGEVSQETIPKNDSPGWSEHPSSAPVTHDKQGDAAHSPPCDEALGNGDFSIESTNEPTDRDTTTAGAVVPSMAGQNVQTSQVPMASVPLWQAPTPESGPQEQRRQKDGTTTDSKNSTVVPQHGLLSESDSIVVRAIVDTTNKSNREIIVIGKSSERRIRDSSVVAWVKETEECICQLCDRRMMNARDGQPYAEAHHVRPLSHDGPDKVENIVCLCSLCHRLMHLGAVAVDYRGRIIVAVGVREKFREIVRERRPHRVSIDSWRHHWVHLFSRPKGSIFGDED